MGKQEILAIAQCLLITSLSAIKELLFDPNNLPILIVVIVCVVALSLFFWKIKVNFIVPFLCLIASISGYGIFVSRILSKNAIEDISYWNYVMWVGFALATLVVCFIVFLGFTLCKQIWDGASFTVTALSGVVLYYLINLMARNGVYISMPMEINPNKMYLNDINLFAYWARQLKNVFSKEGQVVMILISCSLCFLLIVIMLSIKYVLFWKISHSFYFKFIKSSQINFVIQTLFFPLFFFNPLVPILLLGLLPVMYKRIPKRIVKFR